MQAKLYEFKGADKTYGTNFWF